jgi:hypothetical protein
MNYSKVYRNVSQDRFKVRKEKQGLNRFVHLSAQKVVLQEKEKKERKEWCERIAGRPGTTTKRPSICRA